MKNVIRLFAATSVLFMASMAQADVVEFTITGEGNDCAGVYGDSFDSCIITSDDGTEISSIIAKWAADDGWEVNDLYPDFDSDLVSFNPENPDESVTGSWSYDGESMIRFWVVKHGTSFTVFYDTDMEGCAENAESTACMQSANVVTSGDWAVDPNSFSHITFYDSEVRVPEPGTLALLGLGLLGMGAARRRKNA